MAEFGENLKTLRLARGMTQEEMAKLLGTSKQVISRYENGQRTPKITVTLKYAALLGVTPSQLYGEEPLESPPTPRGIEPIHPYRMMVYGPVAAGVPIVAAEDEAEYIDLPCKPEFSADGLVRVQGDSMEPRYLNGDLVFIRKQDDVDDGQIAAVCIDDLVTLKHVYHIPNGVTLVSENAKYPPMTFTTEDANNIHLFGLAVGYMRWER